MPLEIEMADDLPSEPISGQKSVQTGQPPPPTEQSSLDQTILTLAREAFTIGLAVTHDRRTAAEITLETLSAARLNDVRSGLASQAQLRSQILKIARRHSRDPSSEPVAPPPAQGVDAVVWRLLDGLDWRERLVCVLKYDLGLESAESAALFHVTADAIRQQEAIFEKRFRSELGALAKTAKKDPLLLAADAVARRYAPPSWTSQEIAGWIDEANRRKPAVQTPSAIKRSRSWTLAGAGLVLAAGCLGIIAVAAIIFTRSNFSPPAQTPPVVDSTTIPPAQPQVSSLTWLSSSDAVLERIQQSASLWQTLFMDVQVLDFGPPSYIGAPRIYRGQLWVDQPAESIQLIGLLSHSPSSAYLHTGERSLYLNPVNQTSYVHHSILPGVSNLTRPSALVENITLRQMVFPREAKWANEPGTFQMVNTSSILDRPVVVVDWFNQYGQRENRLWLDALCGVVLRQQDFGGLDYSILLAESQATAVSFDQSFPPASLAADMRTVGDSSPLVVPDPSIAIQPTPTAAVPFGRRTVLTSNPAPQGFDPRASQLLFQFPYNLELSNVMTGTAQVPAQLFADSYGIGTANFGLPWMLRCERTPDGYRLAFNTGSDGTSYPDDELRWFDLREPQKIYEPLPGLHVDTFAFSPDSEQLAVFARNSLNGENGILLIEVATGESRHLVSLSRGKSLVYSPDGETLALVGAVEPGERDQVLQIHVRTGQIVFQEPMPPADSPIPQDWPMSNWGFPFPQPEGGLEECASPP